GENEDNQEYYNLNQADLQDSPLSQSILSSMDAESQRYYRGKLDLSFPLGNGMKIEVGGQSNLTIFKIKQALQFADPSLEGQNSDFRVKLWKQALYVQFGQEIKGFSYLLGTRMEYFNSQAEQRSLDSNFSQRYVRLFPSLQLSYQTPSLLHSVGFSYSRRINPPSFFDLNPFIFYLDPLNLSTGNPFLEPAFAYIYELTYNGQYGDLALDLTLFRREETNSIQEIVENLDEERTLQSYQNFARTRNEGLEVLMDYPLGKWLKLSANSSIYRTFFKREPSEEVRNNDQWTWSLQFRQLFKLPRDWQVEISEMYRAPRIGPQIRYLARNYINLSIRKSFQNRRGVIALNFQDIFNTNDFAGEWSGDGFAINYRHKYQTRRISLSLRYKIID
ncbi:MAG: outer membrane beta-barrel family protein, partial [Bacteroidota bacterium]